MTPQAIIAEAARISSLPVETITGPGRTQLHAWARFIAIREINRRCPWFSLGQLAGWVGRKDHGTALHALDQYDRLTYQNGAFRALSQRFTHPVEK